MKAAPPKDPSAILDYTRDWSGWLQTGESIATSAWTITGPDESLVLGTAGRAPTKDATTATCWLLGGTVDATYTVTNHVVTDASPAREDDRSFTVSITER